MSRGWERLCHGNASTSRDTTRKCVNSEIDDNDKRCGKFASSNGLLEAISRIRSKIRRRKLLVMYYMPIGLMQSLIVEFNSFKISLRRVSKQKEREIISTEEKI